MDLNKATSSYSESALLIEKEGKRGNVSIKGSLLGSTVFRVMIVVFFLFLAAVCISFGVTLGIVLKKENVPYVRSFPNAAVATDAEACSTVGAEVLKKGGSAIDAAVASSFCVGVVNLHSTGIGGGGFLIYYNAKNRSSVMIDFREVAASNISSETMEKYITDETSTVRGGLAVMVPGQIRGLHEAWQRYGKLRWQELVQPSIKIARNGFKVTKAVEHAIKTMDHIIEDFEGLKKILKPNGKALKEGDTLKQLELSETLEKIASEGPDYFYNSSFTYGMVKELQGNGSVLTVEDFQNYQVKIREVVLTSYSDMNIHGTTLPGGGAVLGLILNILDGYNITEEDFKTNPVLTYHHVIEAFKFAYGQRLYLGDPDFNDTVKEIFKYMMDPSTADEMRSTISDDTTHKPSFYMRKELYNPPSHGTSHLSVYAEDGDAVAATHSINTYFGSLLCLSGGIIFNNDMDDFSVPGRNNSFEYPPTPANYIGERHRALSSMSPTIITRDGKVVMVVGASGGSYIPTAIAQVVLDILSFGLGLDVAVPSPRLHDQLLPDELRYEPQFPSEIIVGLKAKHHHVVESNTAAIIQAIHVVYNNNHRCVHAASDYRKGGKPDGY